ncbi:hypothetical protein GLOIN_2v1778047 [Rhizophagus irregularis DAOM 181602=DAOM 197198]|uniref:C2H2-type domain-containing protein n=1 Tax=Rhizophagus irregularis (strain DAOM 181602 / DAOM 197198 / MUCL 43194) TaxID=747089 RepID=A0A2P4PTH4_RHIID|nr:hypothetical protein GLOIN_2v1778047 [Rhizophagus irregularis DAOM 181602=DAOM 197198]POG68677.1 hypothetical protein GLOIN_2v1778047 [Rhizophagus irregularis DAOM 181602=DAOM 197198]GET66880.1 hypothetical protein GLOIN_2v1778047 [Rhizophagus irregularis DAOM 181602=DAOM 197198]|eukprot:XP_025175543.1 hypothetical protein GLOIN_2v1778047 [Rhizophagus irregularis DAOM 181602=DAOM 197198]
MESSSSDLSSSTQPPSLPNFLCKVCLRSFHSERGLLLHRKTISKYNRLTEHIDMLLSQTIKEFQEIFVYYIHKKLSKNHTKAGRQTVSFPCTKSQELGKKQLNYIFNDEQWSIKHYDQGQKTYIVLLDQSNGSRNFSAEHNRVKTSETNPLVVLANQRAFGKKNIKRKSRYKRGEVIIEWRERKDHEINDNFCYAGHITMNFYISQIRSLN